jgi:hypothetical protein
MDEIGYNCWIPTGNDPPPPPEPYMPALQRHGPEGDDGCEFAGQATHTLAVVAPVTVEYLPASQATQALAVVAPDVEEYFPAAHATQALSVVAPEVVRYLPAPQAEHALP